MTKFRIITLKDGLGNKFYRVQRKFLGFWFTARIFSFVTESMEVADFLKYKDAANYRNHRLSQIIDYS